MFKRSDFPEQFLRDSSGLSWGECDVAVSQYCRLNENLGGFGVCFFLVFFAFFCLATVVTNPGQSDAGNADRL